MKKVLTIIVTVMMGAVFMYVPAVSFATEQTMEVQTQQEWTVEQTQQEWTVEQTQRDQVVEAAKSQVGYLKGDGDDKYTPNGAGLNMRQVTCEEWTLPGGD